MHNALAIRDRSYLRAELLLEPSNSESPSTNRSRARGALRYRYCFGSHGRRGTLEHGNLNSEQMLALVIPELQSRGLFRPSTRHDVAGEYGLKRPKSSLCLTLIGSGRIPF